MEHNSDQADRLLRQPSSHLSDYSLNSNSTLVTSPTSPPLHRHGHSRETSATEEDTSGHGAGVSQQNRHGLGISNINEQKRASITRKPVEGRTSSAKSLSIDLLLSPISAARQREIHFDDEHEDNLHNDSDVPSHQPFTANSDREPLDKRSSPTQADFECRMKSRPASGRSSWLAVSILVLAIYSTLFSGIWLIIAMMKLPYGHTVSRRGVPFTTASILYTAFAKSIELSFVTVFVAFIGQVLSKRALLQTRGVTMAEMTMRSWVLQPGTIISHWESVKYGLASTKLGIFALLVALMAMTYTTASDALVTPVLQFSKTESRLMFGKVSTSFANTYTVSKNCKTPITETTDPDNGKTCIQIQHSAQAYHNYMQYLTTWVDNISSGNGSDDLTKRPDPMGMFYDNTTLKGSWINVQNSSHLSEQYGRTVNNITMAMPHIGVVTAAMDPINGIIQPSDLNGLGEYTVEASVPSPVINVLCASMNSDDLAPMVYTNWTSFNGTLPNATNWPGGFDLAVPSSLIPTSVDDLFGFDDIQKHPIFPILPTSYNTVFNYSQIYGQDSVYVLATSATGTYTMCSMRVALSPSCSTEYSASVSGGSLTSHCDPDNPLAYIRSEPKAPQGFWSSEWVNVVSEWGNSLSLNDGIVNGNSANARLLAQLIPTSSSLDPSLPSISEALAVLAGGTLILSSQDSPFIHWWNYSASVDTLVDPQYQAFNATLKTREYMSGGQHPWQGVFYIVLLVVFVTNVICLGYFVISGSHLTDFMEPQNMFPLSLNSPPSAVVDGSCGGSLTKEQFRAIWRIVHDSEREHLYIESRDGIPKKARKRGYSRQTDFEMKSPMEIMYSELGRKRTSRL